MSDTERWRCYADRLDGQGVVEIRREDVPHILRTQSLLWIDLLAPTREDTQWLGNVFGFHELALSDLHNNEVRPKQETYDDVLFTVFRAINFNPGEEALDTINLNLFLSDRYVVSTHCKPLRTVNSLIERIRVDRSVLAKGSSFYYYMLLDGVVDRYLDILEELEDKIGAMEERVFQESDGVVQHDIFALKKQVMRFRRLIGPEREALASLVHTPFPQITTDTRIHLRDILDHVLRAQDMCESYRDLLSGLMDSYMSNLSNRMNEVMKLLSVIATIMLPLGFLTGLFGMNFEIIPFIHWQYGFWGLIAVMLLLVALMFWMFKKKRIL